MSTTSLMRKNSFFPFMDSLFNNYFDALPMRYAQQTEGPEVKIKNLDEEIEIAVAVPGISREDIKVDIDDNQLRISSSKKTDFSYSEFTRSWSLPSNVDSSSIKATCEDGVLRVNIPKIHKDKISVPIE